ncbi:MAG: DUF2007 domain-containing protein [Burkholderiaceae bacterium]
MQLLTRSYQTVELIQLRSELEHRGIAVHIADEFTYAIPGMPGAEQPRGVWVADDDLLAAQRVVIDLLGDDRVHRPDAEPNRASATEPGVPQWIWVVAIAIAMFAVLSLTRN